MKETRLVTIDDVCKSGSSNVSQNKLKDIEGIYPIYGASGLIKNVDFYHQEKPYLSIVKDGSGYGRITKMSGKTSVIGTLQYLLPKDNIVLDYLYYGMQSIDFKKYVSGAAIPHIYFKDYKKEPILLRPIEEQKVIVAKLDQAFAALDQAKANIEKNITNAKELFQSKLNQIFSEKGEGWEELYLKDISNSFGRGKSKYRPRNWEGLYGGVYPFVQTGDIRNSDKYVTEFTQTYNEIGLSQSKLWYKGTICITIAANIAETAILNFDACFPDSIIGLEVNNKKANTDFVYYLLQYYKTELQGLSKGFAQQNINLGTFENKKFIFPKSLEIQQQIVNQLDQLQEQTNILVSKYQQKLANLEELKKSILEKAFKGELSTAAIEKV